MTGKTQPTRATLAAGRCSAAASLVHGGCKYDRWRCQTRCRFSREENSTCSTYLRSSSFNNHLFFSLQSTDIIPSPFGPRRAKHQQTNPTP